MAAETIRTAINRALFEKMKKDSSIFLLGEGSRVKFSLDYPSILNSYPNRVITAPVCEGGIIGAALGAAIEGLRPVVDLTFNDLALRAMDEIINHVSKVHFLSGGKLRARVVVKADFNRPENAQSGNRLEAFFVRFPGLRVFVPSNPTDAYEMMHAALAGTGPVVFLEDRVIPSGPLLVQPVRKRLRIGEARVLRAGRDVTVVSYGYGLQMVLEAIELERSRFSIEVIDLRTLRPLDMATVERSVRRTGRLLLVEPDPVKFGIGAEIGATVAADLFGRLEAPVRRIGGPDLLMPAATSLQAHALPSAGAISEAIKALVNGGSGTGAVA